MEALVDIRTARRLADRMQIQPAQIMLQLGDALKMSFALPQPFGQSRLRAVDLDQSPLLVFFDERFESRSFQIRSSVYLRRSHLSPDPPGHERPCRSDRAPRARESPSSPALRPEPQPPALRPRAPEDTSVPI